MRTGDDEEGESSRPAPSLTDKQSGAIDNRKHGQARGTIGQVGNDQRENGPNRRDGKRDAGRDAGRDASRLPEMTDEMMDAVRRRRRGKQAADRGNEATGRRTRRNDDEMTTGRWTGRQGGENIGKPSKQHEMTDEIMGGEVRKRQRDKQAASQRDGTTGRRHETANEMTR